MRPIAGILLALLLTVPFAGVTAWFSGRLVLVRQDAARALASDETDQPLVRLAFAVSEVDGLLEWEHSREFRYRGEMYDVARTDETADSITYWCHHDTPESSLRREINRWLARTYGRPDPGTPTPVQQLASFFAALFPPASPQWSLIAFEVLAGGMKPDTDFGPGRFASQPPSPPPWLA